MCPRCYTCSVVTLNTASFQGLCIAICKMGRLVMPSWSQPSLLGPLSGRHKLSLSSSYALFSPRLLAFQGTASLPPTPRLTLRGSGSSRKSAVSLKTRTGGACGTWAKTDGGAIATECAETSSSSRELLCAVRGPVTGEDAHLRRRAGQPAASNGRAASGAWQRA